MHVVSFLRHKFGGPGWTGDFVYQVPELNLKWNHSLTLFEGLGSLAVVKLAGHNSPWAKCYENASIMQSCDCLAVDLQNIIGWTQEKLMSMSQLGKCVSSMSACFLCRMLFRQSDFATRLQLLLFQLHHLARLWFMLWTCRCSPQLTQLINSY